jgi:hypothetical protein
LFQAISLLQTVVKSSESQIIAARAYLFLGLANAMITHEGTLALDYFNKFDSTIFFFFLQFHHNTNIIITSKDGLLNNIFSRLFLLFRNIVPATNA